MHCIKTTSSQPDHLVQILPPKEGGFGPLISVLVPTFNRVGMVCEALDRIIKYDCDEVLEVIVSDNHSSDKTLEILRERYQHFTKLKLTQPPVAGGPLVNWEHALSLALGTHVHWHWSDDYLCGSFYEQAVALMKKENADVMVAAIKYLKADGNESIWGFQNEVRTESASIALEKVLLQESLPVSPAAYLLPTSSVRKHFYKKIPNVGVYDPIQWAMGTDMLMIAGSLLEGKTVAYLEEPLFCFRDHAESLTNIQNHYFKSYFVAAEWFIRNNKLKIPLSKRRKVFGPVICNAFETKYSKEYFVGMVLQYYKVACYTIKDSRLYEMRHSCRGSRNPS
ncbi:MAG: hypothetical protein A3F67_07440 [Verrucomicrobia bacterium RIFCSPHIGHO2_12_FULL_41_10]|nr:MAG: hypothetical protein A3F67_07440 [Verrucomicrobia bacterium RIFCSPHIGHO2_12_FULL_41_10]HLB33097.1 glycosyltransferase [Chthoniobacterales bacterium]